MKVIIYVILIIKKSQKGLKDKRKDNYHLKKNINETILFRITEKIYRVITKDYDNIQHMCDICIQKNIKFYKKENCKHIIMSKTKELYEIDLTYIPISLSIQIKYKYILNIMDYFSK